MSRTINAQGWTDIVASQDSRVVYVSSSGGNDSNSGLSSALPVKTLAKGYTLLRDGYPDWLLLKCGDTFAEPLGVVVPGVTWRRWRLSGRAESEPMVIGAYGSGARPIVTGGGNDPIYISAAGGVKHLCIVGIEIAPAEAGVGAAGIAALTLGEDLLIEDCAIHDFLANLSLQGPVGVADGLKTVLIRRCAILDAHSKLDGNMRHGIFGSRISGMTIEECLLDKNGWGGADLADMFSQGIYITASSNVTIRKNVIRDSSCNGVKIGGEATVAITGVTISDNLFLDGAYGLVVGSGLDNGLSNVTVQGNVFYNLGTHTVSGQAASIAVTLWAGSNMDVLHNLFLNKSAGGTTALVYLNDSRAYSDVAISNNLAANWNGGKLHLAGGSYSGVVVSGNTLFDQLYQSQLAYLQRGSVGGISFYANDYMSAKATPFRRDVPSYLETDFAGWVAYAGESGSKWRTPIFADSTRTPASYAASIGLASEAAMIAAMRAQRRSTWRTDLEAAALNSYLAAGFTVTSWIEGPQPPPPTSLTVTAQTLGQTRTFVLSPAPTGTFSVAVSAVGYKSGSASLVKN